MATVTRLNWVAWHDNAAQVAYQETYSDGLTPFTGTLREKYTKALTDKLRRLDNSPSGSDREMALLIQLDAGTASRHE